MFGLGAGELILIAVVALLFVGPDKLPQAAKTIGRGIRGLRQQTSDLTRTIEQDTQIGEAVRDLRSALRGEDALPPRPPRVPRPPPVTQTEQPDATAAAAGDGEAPGSQPAPPAADSGHGTPLYTSPADRDGDDAPVARGSMSPAAPAGPTGFAGVSTGTLRDRVSTGTLRDRASSGTLRDRASSAKPAADDSTSESTGGGEPSGSGSAHG